MAARLPRADPANDLEPWGARPVRRTAAPRVFRILFALAILVALLPTVPQRTAASLLSDVQEMHEIRDVLAQIDQRERDEGHAEPPYLAGTSKHAGHASGREGSLALAFGALHDALTQLRLLPQECNAVDEAARHTHHTRSLVRSYLDEIRGMATDMTGALDRLEQDLERVEVQLRREEDTGVVQMNAKARPAEQVVRRRDVLKGYKAALGMCMMAADNQAQLWGPLEGALEGLSSRTGRWKQGAEACDASGDLDMVRQVILLGGMVLGV